MGTATGEIAARIRAFPFRAAGAGVVFGLVFVAVFRAGAAGSPFAFL
jgi:hypothetical protein